MAALIFFSPRYKKAYKGNHAWLTKQVENGERETVIKHLIPETLYEFSVLPVNEKGSGPFSRVSSMSTKGITLHCGLIMSTALKNQN